MSLYVRVWGRGEVDVECFRLAISPGVWKVSEVCMSCMVRVGRLELSVALGQHLGISPYVVDVYLASPSSFMSIRLRSVMLLGS